MNRRAKTILLVFLPIILYFIIVSQLSWRPRTLARQESFVRSVVFSPDGEMLASATDKGIVRLWHVSTGTLQKTLTGHRQSVYTMAFSPDGSFLTSGSADGTVRLWDTRSGKAKHVLNIKSRVEPWIYAWLLDISADSKVLYVLDCGQKIQLWDTASGKLITKSPKLELRDDAAAFSPDKKMLAGRSDEGATFWSVPSGEWRGAVGQSELSSGVGAMDFASDGQSLASAGSDKTVRVWDIRTSSLLRTLQHQAEVNLVAFSPGSKTLVSASGANGISSEVVIWDTPTGNLIRRIPSRRVWCMALSPDGTKLASANQDNTVTLWRIK